MRKQTIKQIHQRVSGDKKRKSWKAWVFAFLIAGIVGSCVYVLNLDRFQITEVKVSGAYFNNESEIQDTVSNLLKGRNVFFVPHSHVWFYPKNSIITTLEHIPSIPTVSLSLDNHALTVTLNERQQKYLWCADEKNCFFVDKDGFVFSEAPQFNGDVYTIFRGGDIKVENPLGNFILPTLYFDRLQSFVEVVTSFDVRVVSIDVSSLYHVDVVTADNTIIKISLEKPLDEVTSNLKTLLNSADFAKVSGGLKGVSYIDLRYGAKVFWKAK